MVDRAFHRDRFARAAEPVDDQADGCANCSTPEGDGVRIRMLKDFAFHVVGTGEDARELGRSIAQVPLDQARATGSWRTIVAPPHEHRPLHAVGNELIEALVGRARDALADARVSGQTDYLQVVQNWGAQAGARTNHLCLDLYDLPQIPHRIAEEMGGAARFVIGKGSARSAGWSARHRRRRAARLGGRLERGHRAVRLALAVRGLDRAARPPGGLRSGDRLGRRRHRRSASPGAVPPRHEPRWPAVQPRAAQRAAARAGRCDLPLALGDPPEAARDRGPGAGHRPAGQPGLAGGRGRGCLVERS